MTFKVLSSTLIIVALVSCNNQSSKQEVSATGKTPIISLKKIAPSDEIHSDTTLILDHLTTITKNDVYRQYKNVQRLDTVAAYIHRHFSRFADTTYYQEYEFDGQVYRNVICLFNGKSTERIIIGAHYDVCGNQEGADDNASGVVGLLELARLLENKDHEYQIELVAYTLEEPPFFRTEMMGSFIHAQSMVKDSVSVKGMVCLEMIGYFSDEKKSQDYPVGGMGAVYGKTGDYISLVNKMSPGNFVNEFNKEFKKIDRIKTKHISAPASIQGIDFSDHLNYWLFDISALMITDTAFYRNKNYHENSDKLETLDVNRMAKVIESVCITVIAL
jgi:hypothetical protein